MLKTIPTLEMIRFVSITTSRCLYTIENAESNFYLMAFVLFQCPHIPNMKLKLNLYLHAENFPSWVVPNILLFHWNSQN